MFKLLIIDIDGVMTDGTKTYDESGKAVYKNFNDLDFTAIKLFKQLGVKVCFLSGDININENMARERNIDFWHAKTKDNKLDKTKFIKLFIEKYSVQEDEMAYIGDDIFDIEMCKRIKESYCPRNASEFLKPFVKTVLNEDGGHGVILELLIKYIQMTGIYHGLHDAILRLIENDQ